MRTCDFSRLIMVFNLNKANTGLHTSVGYSKFRELTFDFFLQQVNMFPTRRNNILDLVLTTTPDNVVNLSCVSATSVDLSSYHSLTFFDFLLHVKLTRHHRRTMFDFQRADWYGLKCALKGIWQQKIFLAHLKELLKSFSKLFYSFYISRLVFEILRLEERKKT